MFNSNENKKLGLLFRSSFNSKEKRKKTIEKKKNMIAIQFPHKISNKIILNIMLSFILSLWSLCCDTLFLSYDTFNNAKKSGSKTQVQGLITDRGNFNVNKFEFNFSMKDKDGTEAQVIFKKPKPVGFDHAEEVVAIGKFKDNVFLAEEVLTKCPSKYEEQSKQGVPIPTKK